MPKYRKVRPGLGINFAYQEVLQGRLKYMTKIHKIEAM